MPLAVGRMRFSSREPREESLRFFAEGLRIENPELVSLRESFDFNNRLHCRYFLPVTAQRKDWLHAVTFYQIPATFYRQLRWP